ncbi:radical SAM protein, partial [bacterium]|nr:radical SAM protein [bacterium]
YEPLDHLYVVFSITTRCNFNCSYCSAKKFSMKEESVKLDRGKKILEKLVDFGLPYTQIVFHGGEPLIEFKILSKLIEFIRESLGDSKAITLGIQTNLSLLTEEMAQFFKTYDVSIGFSLDGDFRANQATRKSKDSEKTFNSIMQGIEILRKYQKRLGCICVISEHNIDSMDRIMDFFASLRLESVILNQATPLGVEAEYIATHGVSADDFFQTLISLWERQRTNGWPKIQPIETLVDLIHKKTNIGHQCYPCSAGWSIISVDPSGNVYPCGRFCQDPNWICGNLLEDDLLEIYNNEKMKQIRLRGQRIPECNSCEFKDMCGGGCAASAYYSSGRI